ncbi:hypothetical protein VULLAG_LOCUS20060 [Vulpes lagopus]
MKRGFGNYFTQTETRWGGESQKAEVPIVLIPHASAQATHTLLHLSSCQGPAPRRRASRWVSVLERHRHKFC